MRIFFGQWDASKFMFEKVAENEDRYGYMSMNLSRLL